MFHLILTFGIFCIIWAVVSVLISKLNTLANRSLKPAYNVTMFPMYLKLSSVLESLGISICELILGVAANLQVLSFHVHPTTTCNFCGEGKYLLCRVFQKSKKLVPQNISQPFYLACRKSQRIIKIPFPI